MRARRAPRHQFVARGMTFDDEDAVSGVERLEGAGFPLREIAAALNRDQEPAQYFIGTANGVLLPGSIDGLRRLASSHWRRSSAAQVRRANRFLAPRR